jgi:hypothetical protein
MPNQIGRKLKMFGLFKPKLAPQEPVEFIVSIEITSPVEDVYALIEWSNPLNAKRQLGNRVKEIGESGKQFVLVLEGLPDYDFEITVTDSSPGSAYAFDCVIEPTIGNLASAHESYHFEPSENGGCVLSLTTTANFVEGLTMDQFEEEIGMMAASSQSALEKLRIHAEHGLSAMRAVEDRLVL